MQVGKGRVVKVTGIENPGRSATVLLRGSNKLVLEVMSHDTSNMLQILACNCCVNACPWSPCAMTAGCYTKSASRP